MLKIADGIEITNLSQPTIGELEHAHCSGNVAFEDGELFAVFFHAIVEAHRKQAIFGTWKKPGEKEWSKPIVISKDVESWRMEGNPAIWIAPDTKKLWMFYITSWGGWSTCILRYKTSDDRGRTWSKSKKIHKHISRVSKNPPILTSKGLYILPTTIEFQECVPLFYISKDQGKKWRDVGARVLVPEKFWPPNKAETSKFPARQLDQPTIIERKDGSILCLMRAYRPLGKMYQTVSKDGGHTWSDAEPGILPNPDGGFHMIRLKSGNIAIIYNHSATARNPLSVAISEDEGVSWKYRRNIIEFHKDKEEDIEHNFQYPTICQGLDEKMHVTWSNGYSNPDAANGRATDIQYTSFSEDWVKQQPYFEEEWKL
jgi:predicted neuraminidase